MKIKQVCEQTGLTDRAIRYYIDEGLLSPAYTENYMGRRAYDFTEADVTALNHVATLRKFGFTVEEIRRILTDPQESIAVLEEVRARKEETLRQEGANLDALSRLEAEKAYTVAELAEKLAEPVREVEVPKEDRWMNWKERLIVWLKAPPIWVVMLLPVLLLTAMVVTAVLDFRFLHVKVAWLGMAITLAPTLVVGAVLVLGRVRRVRYGVKLALAVLALMWFVPMGLIVGAFSMDFYSETTDIAHYRQVDDLFYWNETEKELFPEQTGKEGRYYYYCSYDRCQSLYAEWVLPQDEQSAEVARVTDLLSEVEGYHQFQHGSYVCQAVAGDSYSPEVPFQQKTGRHSVTFFAYEPQTGVVRYIVCDEYADADDLPYYMTLDWGEEVAS